MKQRLFALADRFVPETATDFEAVRRARSAVFQSWLGVFFSGTFGIIYASLGSAWSGLAILLITAGLLAVPWWVRRGHSISWIANALIGQTWLATFIVVTRSGGFTSPALVWTFLLPPCIYSVAGRSAATFWSIASGVQILFFYVAELWGVSFAQDFSKTTLSVLRISGFTGTIVATVAVLLVFESARNASLVAREQEQRTQERQRILDDMHDGVGSQLLGLIVRLRGPAPSLPELASGLESCLDDLRLIVDSMDPLEHSFELALGTLRARIETRCEAAGVELHWRAELAPGLDLGPERGLHVLRSLQELVTNALRHAGTPRVDVTVGDSPALPGWLDLAVRDYGVGFDAARVPRHTRGMKSLESRARKLGGLISFHDAKPGAVAILRFPSEA